MALTTTIDVAKSALQNICDLVNEVNSGLGISATSVTAGTPSVITEPDVDGRNTSVVLTAVSGQGYSGSKSINYARLGMDSGVVTPVTSVTVLEADNQAEVQTKVATALGLIGSELAFTAYTAAQVGTDGTITVGPATNSLLYVGATKDVALTISSIDLSSSITTTDTNGFAPAS